jgi:hypothetical protein
VRPRLSYANVMATAAVFIALGGGAYAALGGIPDGSGVFHGCVAKTGALRVVKSAASCRKARKVRRHGKKVRLPGEFAIAWNQKGAPGTTGPGGAPGTPGTPGTPGPFPATLASGKSLTGVYRAAETSAGDVVPDAVTFVYPLASKPTVHFIPFDAQPPTECPGTQENPKAAPGHLCVYAILGNSTVSVLDPATNSGPDSSRFGFVVVDSTAGGFTSGTWAVTAP